MEFVAFKSKRSGRYFKFDEYCDDGYGEYIDSISYPFTADDLPFFMEEEMIKFKVNKAGWLGYAFKDHKWSKVEQVRFTLEINLK